MIYVVTNNEGKIIPISKPFGTNGMSAPIGSITPGFAEDEKWMFCEGQQLSVKEYPALFDIIGYTYGGADDYFNLPDMREYAPCGAGKRTSNTSEEMILGRCYESQIGSHTHTQNAHCHCRPEHGHLTNTHSHTIPSHCHFYSTYTTNPICNFWKVAACPFTNASKALAANCTSGIYGTVCSAGGNSSTNSTGNLNAATACNCSTGATSGGTHGRRYGMRYLIRII